MPDTPSANVLDTLLHLMRDLRRNYDTRAEAVGMTMSRARALTTLSRMEGITQTTLAAELGIEAPTLKRQIDALESAGFVARRPLEGDARKNALFLTDKGRNSGIVDFTRRLRADLVSGISEDDLARTKAVLDRIAENVDRLARE